MILVQDGERIDQDERKGLRFEDFALSKMARMAQVDIVTVPEEDAKIHGQIAYRELNASCVLIGHL